MRTLRGLLDREVPGGVPHGGCQKPQGVVGESPLLLNDVERG